jgi:hypothetical protein
MKELIDTDFIVANVLEMNEKIKIINKAIPEGNEHFLKHLAASAIHLALFMKDFYEVVRDEKVGIDKEHYNNFLQECGCDFNKTR